MAGQWAPLKTSGFHDRTGTALGKKWGCHGLAVWDGYLRACKRSWMKGRFIYTVGLEREALADLIGAAAEHGVPFTLGEFFTYTGRLRNTKVQRIGREVHVLLTAYEDWNRDAHQEHERDRKARQRANGDHAMPKVQEHLPDEPVAVDPVREVYEHWVQARGKQRTQLTEDRRTKIRARLKVKTVEDLKRAIDGVALDPWSERPRNDDIVTIFKSDALVDRFLGFHKPVPRPNMDADPEPEIPVDPQAHERLKEMLSKIGQSVE